MAQQFPKLYRVSSLFPLTEIGLAQAEVQVPIAETVALTIASLTALGPDGPIFVKASADNRLLVDAGGGAPVTRKILPADYATRLTLNPLGTGPLGMQLTAIGGDDTSSVELNGFASLDGSTFNANTNISMSISGSGPVSTINETSVAYPFYQTYIAENGVTPYDYVVVTLLRLG